MKNIDCALLQNTDLPNQGGVKARPTVSLLISCDGKLVLVKPQKAVRLGHLNWWILPQEGVEADENALPGRTALRCLFEEFEMKFDPPEIIRVEVLGSMFNQLPEGRTRSGCTAKSIVCLAMMLSHFNAKLNRRENSRYRFVDSLQEFSEATTELAEHRPLKGAFTRHMVKEACMRKFLPWPV